MAKSVRNPVLPRQWCKAGPSWTHFPSYKSGSGQTFTTDVAYRILPGWLQSCSTTWGVVVLELEATAGFFVSLGFVREGPMAVSGSWMDRTWFGRRVGRADQGERAGWPREAEFDHGP